MSVTELRCPSCGAPVDTFDGRTQTCHFCDASLVTQAPGTEMDRHEEHFVTLQVVGPSNRTRIIELLVAELAIEPAAAQAVVCELPGDLGAWKRAEEAANLCAQLEAGGAIARVGIRIVETPRLPARTVVLEDAGPEPLRAIKVVREHLSIGLKDAKDLIDSAPCELARALEAARADQLRDDLAAVGANVRLV